MCGIAEQRKKISATNTNTTARYVGVLHSNLRAGLSLLQVVALPCPIEVAVNAAVLITNMGPDIVVGVAEARDMLGQHTANTISLVNGMPMVPQ